MSSLFGRAGNIFWSLFWDKITTLDTAEFLMHVSVTDKLPKHSVIVVELYYECEPPSVPDLERVVQFAREKPGALQATHYCLTLDTSKPTRDNKMYLSLMDFIHRLAPIYPFPMKHFTDPNRLQQWMYRDGYAYECDQMFEQLFAKSVMAKTWLESWGLKVPKVS